jgi:CHAT domain-containing protein/Tfp pilus assembly protein PilF
MQRILGCVAVLVLGCSSSPPAGALRPDARLREAQSAFLRARAPVEAGWDAESKLHAQVPWLRTDSDIVQGMDVFGALNGFPGGPERADEIDERATSIMAVEGIPPLAAPTSLESLASHYEDRWLPGGDAALYERELAKKEATLGGNHPDVATSLDALAAIYAQQGLYGRAGPLYERALAIRETALGKSHPTVAASLNSLAHLSWKQGLYGQAEPRYERALAIWEAALGENHPTVAQSLNNLALIYKEQGLYGRAEPLYLRALSIYEAALGSNHPIVAQSLNNLAALHAAQGLYGRAEPLYRRALALFEAVRGGGHPDVATSLNNLGLLYAAQGLYGRAEPLYARALGVFEAALGKDHPAVATTLHNLASLYQAQEQYGRAEPLYARALAIREAALGKSHPTVAASLNSLALLRLAQRRLDAAVPLFARAFAVSEQRLRQEALDFSETRLDSLLKLLRTEEERLYALLRAHPEDARVRRLALGAALLLKGRSAEETADISRSVYRSLGAEERDTFQRLRELRTQRASLSLQGPGPRSLADHQRQLEALAGQGDALEALLARRSAPLRALAALPAPDDIVDHVAEALPGDGALVELILYEDRPLLPGPDAPRSRLRYLALVLLPDGSIHTADLGLAGPIDLAVSRLRDALANREAEFQAHAQVLHQRVFQPLRPLLGKARRLFLSPEGQLALVPFAALHDGHAYLAETLDFVYLTSGKELLPRAEPPVPAASVVVLADPDFGAALARAERPTSVARSASSWRDALTNRDWNLTPLPGSRQEAEAIQRLLPQAQVFLGTEATKERLLNLPPAGILHLATHGFFLEDVPVPPQSRAIVSFGALGEDPHAPRLPDPLLRSGLLFAGANAPTASSSGSPPESSLATALELAGLDLWGTQLVVLSACDTGRGDVRLGQGVYGLRRALVVAGAETVVMSLWKVNDDSTRRLMEAYYRKLLEGQGRAAALREAMLWLRATRPHPHDWAPFIVLGRDAPLRGLDPRP